MRVRDALAAEIDAGRLPGAVFGLWVDGQPPVSFALGRLDPSRDAPMTTDAIFRVYSMTKVVTSIAALMLVEAGALRLPDHVASILPAFTHDAPTVEDLLMHTSGLTYGPRAASQAVREAYAGHGLAVLPRALTADALVRGLSSVPLVHAPGTAWEYGSSTDLLGVLVETIVGQRLGAFVRERVLAPLGMHDTGFVVDAASADRIAQPFAADPSSGAAPAVPDQTFDALDPPRLDSGGAGLVSTLDDWMRLARCLLGGGRLGDVRLLRTETVESMTRDHLARRGIPTRPGPGVPALDTPGYGFGYGLGVRLPGPLADLPGSPGTFLWSGTAGTTFWVDPVRRFAAVFLSQSPGPGRVAHRRLVIESVWSDLA